VILVNHGQEPVTLSRGDRIAQLVVVAHGAPELTEVDTLPGSERGEGGFGSSGR
jgi:dUTP pyrophosphatase